MEYGRVVGKYFADLLVSKTVIVELKAAKEISDAFAAHCLNCLKATGLPICLLLNFGKTSRRDETLPLLICVHPCVSVGNCE